MHSALERSGAPWAAQAAIRKLQGPPWARINACDAHAHQAERAVALRLDSARQQAASLRETLRAQRDELGE